MARAVGGPGRGRRRAARGAATGEAVVGPRRPRQQRRRRAVCRGPPRRGRLERRRGAPRPRSTRVARAAAEAGVALVPAPTRRPSGLRRGRRRGRRHPRHRCAAPGCPTGRLGWLAALPETAHVIAVDLPSGQDPMGGELDPDGVFADETVTFSVAKPVHLLPADRAGLRAAHRRRHRPRRSTTSPVVAPRSTTTTSPRSGRCRCHRRQVLPRACSASWPAASPTPAQRCSASPPRSRPGAAWCATSARRRPTGAGPGRGPGGGARRRAGAGLGGRARARRRRRGATGAAAAARRGARGAGRRRAGRRRRRRARPARRQRAAGTARMPSPSSPRTRGSCARLLTRLGAGRPRPTR